MKNLLHCFFICFLSVNTSLFSINPFLDRDLQYNPIVKSPCGDIFADLILNNPEMLSDKLQGFNEFTESLNSYWNIKGFHTFNEKNIINAEENLLILGYDGVGYGIDLMMKQTKANIIPKKDNIHILFPESYDEIGLSRTFAMINFINSLHSGQIGEAKEYFSKKEMLFDEIISSSFLTKALNDKDLDRLESLVLDILSLLTPRGHVRVWNANSNPNLLHVLKKLKAERKIDYAFSERDDEDFLIIRKLFTPKLVLIKSK